MYVAPFCSLFYSPAKATRTRAHSTLSCCFFVCSFKSEHVPGGPWNHGPVISSSMKWQLWDIKNPPNIVCVAKQGTLWHQNGPWKMEPYILPHTFQNLAHYDEKEINIYGISTCLSFIHHRTLVFLTLFISITMLCGTNNILCNYPEYSSCSKWMS